MWRPPCLGLGCRVEVAQRLACGDASGPQQPALLRYEFAAWLLCRLDLVIFWREFASLK
jgi:hypothetical protein